MSITGADCGVPIHMCEEVVSGELIGCLNCDIEYVVVNNESRVQVGALYMRNSCKEIKKR